MESRDLYAVVKQMPRSGVSVTTVPDADYMWAKEKFPDLVLLPASILHFARVDGVFRDLVNEFASIRTLGPLRTPEERVCFQGHGN